MNKNIPRRTAPQTVTIIGAGRLGTALGLAVATRGYQVACFVAAQRSSARRAARIIGQHIAHDAGNSIPRPFAAAELDRLPPTAIYLFATPDDALPGASLALSCAIDRRAVKTPVALHTSGALTAEVLKPLQEIGFSVGSLHPLVSIAADPHAGALSLSEAFYCVEGDAVAVRAARRLVRVLGGRSFTVPASKKALYHAAAVVTSGHTVALFDVACEMLTRCGLDSRTAREVLLPLLASTTRNLHKSAPAQAMTGTFARADSATLERHLASLTAERLNFAAEVYRLLGRRAVSLARANGADSCALKSIERLLDKE